MIRLVRFAYLPDATLGRLELGGGPDGPPALDWWTVEPPWQGNQPFKSCIPEGRYPLRATVYTSRRGDSYPTWEVAEVPDRWAIKIHVANRASELAGCIAPGLDCRHAGVWHSREALRELLTALEPRDPGPTLEVTRDLRRFAA